SANFDMHRSYEWPIIRPRSAANAAHPDNITPINTVADIRIHDTDTNAFVPLTDANLNTYVRFDDSQWNWGSISETAHGQFRFELLPDKLGNPDRVIALTYSPVPEPTSLVLVGVVLGGAWIRRTGRPFRRSDIRSPRRPRLRSSLARRAPVDGSPRRPGDRAMLTLRNGIALALACASGSPAPAQTWGRRGDH